MKKALALVLALMMLLPLVACGGGSTTTGGSAAAASGAASGSAAASASGSAAQTFTVPTDDKYNGMTADQLLEAAKKESGPIVVYCTTSKMSKVAEAFMAEYPDLQVEVNDLDGGESITKVVTEVDSGNVLCDVVQDSDALGDVAFNYYGKYLDAYFPHRHLQAHIDADPA
jgi:ABC-type glycerol-3-phosphate transport system substrate-binding protein